MQEPDEVLEKSRLEGQVPEARASQQAHSIWVDTRSVGGERTMPLTVAEHVAESDDRGELDPHESHELVVTRPVREVQTLWNQTGAELSPRGESLADRGDPRIFDRSSVKDAGPLVIGERRWLVEQPEETILHPRAEQEDARLSQGLDSARIAPANRLATFLRCDVERSVERSRVLKMYVEEVEG